MNSDLMVIRRLRNRIAHHEPIFTRNLQDDFRRIIELVELRSPDVASWMIGNQFASRLLPPKPVFCGGQNWNPSQSEIAAVAYSIWEEQGRQSDCDQSNWDDAIQRMKGL